MSKHFKMYITMIIMGEKRIDLAYPIRCKEVAIVGMFRDNVQYQIRESVKVLLMTEEKELPVGMFMGRELSASLGEKLITTSLVAKGDSIKTDKLTGVTEVVISLDKLDNTDNLEDGRLSNVLRRDLVPGSEEFTRLEPVAPKYKKHENGYLLP